MEGLLGGSERWHVIAKQTVAFFFIVRLDMIVGEKKARRDDTLLIIRTSFYIPPHSMQKVLTPLSSSFLVSLTSCPPMR